MILEIVIGKQMFEELFFLFCNWFILDFINWL